MENVGFTPDYVYATVHTEAHNHKAHTSKSQGFFGKDFSTQFHVYAIEWTPDRIVFFVDGKQYHQYINEKAGAAQWPFDIPFHLLLNVAVGGSWGGKQGIDDSVFPQKMLVDYVRVYQ
ncbi:glycoside hydrolase family 16 protein [Flavobacterium sp. WC2509]|uniref:glycoside hydrolase family 16 protein n=1 Tax=Flavobacterium sp. WC2509 TaxID=3461406 RepID=UPI00404419D1